MGLEFTNNNSRDVRQKYVVGQQDNVCGYHDNVALTTTKNGRPNQKHSEHENAIRRQQTNNKHEHLNLFPKQILCNSKVDLVAVYV